MSDAPQDSAAPLEEYCRFAKRNLDGMSWLYPLVNNRIGDLLNLELRHQHLFFIRGQEITYEIGYSEKGTRFHEADCGKVMHTLEDLTRQGYWLVHLPHNARAGREALNRVQDGAYYSLFSNQCQDWADRVEREIISIEKEQGLGPPAYAFDEGLPPALERPVAPTVPSAWYLGLITLLGGTLGVFAPYMAAAHYIAFLGALLCAIGVSDIVYAFSSKAWHNLVATVITGLLYVGGGLAVVLNDQFAVMRSEWLLGGVLLLSGAARLGMGLRSRPHHAWAGTAVAGLLLCAAGSFVIWQGVAVSAYLLGLTISLALISGGLSTIILNFRNRAPSSDP